MQYFLLDLTRIKPDGYALWDKYGKDGGELVSFLLWAYEGVELPSIEHVDVLAKEIGSQNVKHNGKILKYLLISEESEDMASENIRVMNNEVMGYRNLLKRGLFYPRRSYKCPRVTDSFNQMPFWIRKEIKINGEKIVELDFSALHPNLCYLAFNNNIPSVERAFFKNHLAGDVHGNIVNELNEMGLFQDVDAASMRSQIKKEHLSYFNDWKGRQNGYKVDRVYSTKMPRFLELIRETKRKTYKNTSSMLFQLEVDLMTEICRRFYLNGIRALYVYDALYVPASKSAEAKKIMNTVAADFGLLTRVDAPKFAPFKGPYHPKYPFSCF